MDEELLKTLYKKATGYSFSEVTEEYSVDDNGQINLVKRKVAKKYCPPDPTAMKTYIELSGESGLSKLTDEELAKEKTRLLAQLKESEKGVRQTKKGGKNDSGQN